MGIKIVVLEILSYGGRSVGRSVGGMSVSATQNTVEKRVMTRDRSRRSHALKDNHQSCLLFGGGGLKRRPACDRYKN